MKPRKILVPLDFSAPSRLALNHGIAMARMFRAKLVLLNVIEIGTASLYTFPTEVARIEAQQEEQAWRMLPAMVAAEDQDDLDLEVLVKKGSIESEILTAIDQEKADVVVMGTHGRGLAGRTFIGSVTQHLLRKVRVPILTVCHVGRPLRFDRILYATDLSDSSLAGFQSVLALARQAHSNVTLLHAVDTASLVSHTSQSMVTLDIRGICDDARARLNELAAQGHGQNVKVEAAFLEANPADAILKTAEDSCADLIVITVGKKNLLERTLLGSTAERIIRESHLPVLSIPVG